MTNLKVKEHIVYKKPETRLCDQSGFSMGDRYTINNGLMSLQTNDPVDIIPNAVFVADALVVFDRRRYW